MIVFVLFVCMAGPAALSVLIHQSIAHKKAALFEQILLLIVYSFLILFLSCVTVFLRGHIAIPFEELFATVNNIMKYSAISLIFAVFLPNILLLGNLAYKAIWAKKEKSDEE